MSKGKNGKNDEEDGPRQLPQVVLREKGRLQLFLTYLKQQPTSNWVMALAYDANRLREISNYMHTLKICGWARNEEELRKLVTLAPALSAVWDLIAGNSRLQTVIPHKAYPSSACITALSDAYDAWVERQARL